MSVGLKFALLSPPLNEEEEKESTEEEEEDEEKRFITFDYLKLFVLRLCLIITRTQCNPTCTQSSRLVELNSIDRKLDLIRQVTL